MASGSCCRRLPDCEVAYCRCTCPRCTRTKGPNVLKAGVTAAIAITAIGAAKSKKSKLNRQFSYKWPGSVEEDDGPFSSSYSRQSSVSSTSSFGSSFGRQNSSSSFGRQNSTSSSPSSSVFNFPSSPPEEPRSPFSPTFGKESPFKFG